MFTARCLSNTLKDKSGFKTTDDAEAYIAEYICDGCFKDFMDCLARYFNEPVPGEYKPSVLWTDCGAEWNIIPDEEYKELME